MADVPGERGYRPGGSPTRTLAYRLDLTTTSPPVLPVWVDDRMPRARAFSIQPTAVRRDLVTLGEGSGIAATDDDLLAGHIFQEHLGVKVSAARHELRCR